MKNHNDPIRLPITMTVSWGLATVIFSFLGVPIIILAASYLAAVLNYVLFLLFKFFPEHI